MKTDFGYLTYCSNIHAGESWADHFAALRKFIPSVKVKCSPDQPFGIGLRLSNEASIDLAKEGALVEFKDWLSTSDCYVFTMNGFPYGGFHNTRVKEQVHAPDWTTNDRVNYTTRLFDILSQLLPAGMEGGISTSPLTYRYWHKPEELHNVFEVATMKMIEVAKHLKRLHDTTGQLLHLDIEPEPDGLLESGPEFIDWYKKYLLPLGVAELQKEFDLSVAEAEATIKRHVQLCYDVCHFAVGYENHQEVVNKLSALGIKTGKIQISAALKAPMASGESRNPVIAAFKGFNESTYLHQVVARTQSDGFKRYPDLPEALADADNQDIKEWRSHFHVPLFVEDYGVLKSTQEDIVKVLDLQKTKPFTHHLEIETYTWEVLPDGLKLPIDESIVREMKWVINQLNG
ncbi:metabolite traffic protein EboE [Imperialibacter roseus]|uniref:Metabolite traffic protein EboE n=1 Tax=Imperialibacter roseus TaxID=1324217 RepID=A0ABZ0IVX5_9BACT|nr:metabolite traffic protein EboE [Imperialibacter roseus]WOK08941.1 metabolite traffic protein EboE [Imperialibacter roseus]